MGTGSLSTGLASPSARRVEGGLADTRAEGESMSAEGSESACLKRLKDCLFPSWCALFRCKSANAYFSKLL